ncbi:hypothetical protein SO694_00038050 [Aureococcus anophagefferens]|uniref:EF-hand domain-containing protein n=1 Tax=Aureococcus anophagefferens TaxID=44056 RepID=A0ABR1FLV8_AURAN
MSHSFPAQVENAHLTKLDLSWNALGTSSGIAIGVGLGVNRALRWLNLAYNSIGDKGAAAIGRALDSNGRLRTLNLAHTGVGPVAAMVIAEGMRENYALDVLNVSGNPVGFLGGRALMRVLNTSRRPRTLLMNDVAFDVSAAGGFDSDSPAGKYVLDIDDPGDWMVARALVWIATTRPGARFKRIAEVADVPPEGEVSDLDKSPEQIRAETVDRLVVSAAKAQGAIAPPKEAKPNRRQVTLVRRFDDNAGKGAGTVGWKPPKKARKRRPKMDEATANRLQKRLRDAIGTISIKALFKRYDQDMNGIDADEFIKMTRRDLRLPKDGAQGVTDDEIDWLVTALDRAAKGCEIPNFKGSYLGRFPLALDTDQGGTVNPDELDDFLELGTAAFFTADHMDFDDGSGGCGSGDDDEAPTPKKKVVANPFAPEWKAAKMLQRRLRTIRMHREAQQRAAILATNSDVAQQRLRILKRCLLDGDTGEPFEPRRGAKLELEFEQRALPASELGMLNATGLLAVAQVLVRTTLEDRLTLLRLAFAEVYVVAAQAQDLLDRVGSSHRPFDGNELVEALFCLLQRVVDTQSVHNLMERNLSRDQAVLLRSKFGGAYCVFTGALCGHHDLDLTRPVERAALHRLVTYDAIQAAQQRGAFGDDGGDAGGEAVGVYANEDTTAALARGGTSQHGDYRGFRNATMNRVRIKHDAIERLAVGFGSMGAHDPNPVAGKRTLSFDYVANLKPPTTAAPAGEARVDTLLHSCGLKFDATEVTKSAKLTRLMPTFMFQQVLRKKTVRPKELRVVGYKSASQSSESAAEAAAAHKREKFKRLKLKGVCDRSAHHGKPWDVADWLEARYATPRVTWHRADLESLAASLDVGEAAMRCDVEEGRLLPAAAGGRGGAGPGESLPSVKIVRSVFEVRARVCHPGELSALTWRHAAPTPGDVAKRESVKHSDLLPAKFDSNRSQRSQPRKLKRRTSMDDLSFISKVQAAIRARAARAASKVAHGAPPVIETFISRRLPVDQDGRLQSNPARAAILGVVEACRDRLGVRVGHEDVRLTLRCKNGENASSLPPKFLDGVDTAATVFYYDVYVRGLPERPFLPCRGDSGFVHGAWVPYEECEEPPSPEELDFSKVVLQCRLATTSDLFLCRQIRHIVERFEHHKEKLEIQKKWRERKAAMEKESKALMKRRASLDRLASFGRSGGRDLSPAMIQRSLAPPPARTEVGPAAPADGAKPARPRSATKRSNSPDGAAAAVDAVAAGDAASAEEPEEPPPPPVFRPLADLVVHLFSRCLDPENFYWAVLDPTFPIPQNRNEVIHRLGWLNVLDVRNPEIAGYDIDLRYPDHWKVAHVLTQLAAVEPGLNFKHPTFRRLHGLDPIPGWDLPANWDVVRYTGNLAKGIPTDGALTLDYECDADDLELRRDLGDAFTLARVQRPQRSAIEAATLLDEDHYKVEE